MGKVIIMSHGVYLAPRYLNSNCKTGREVHYDVC